MTFVSGKLKLADGTVVGEVRSGNTVIVTQPSAHVDAQTKGGGYRWRRWGAAPPLPAEALRRLRVLGGPTERVNGVGHPIPPPGAALTFKNVAEWLDRFDDDYEPELLTAEVERFWKLVGSGDNRHDAMLKVVVSALRKARVRGSFSARRAERLLRGAWPQAIAPDYPHHLENEFDKMLPWAAGGIEAELKTTKTKRPLWVPSGFCAVHQPVPPADTPREVENPMKIYDDVPEPGTEEYKQVLQQALWAKQLAAEIAAEDARRIRGNGASSWQRVELHEVIYGELAELVPAVLARTDGRCLGYPGATHSIHGPTGSAKTWLALLAVAQCLKRGERALYLDYESFPVQIVKRLLLLGVSEDALDERLQYYRPECAPDVLDIDRNAFSHLLSREYGVAVLDGANISMALCGLSSNDAEDVALLARQDHAAHR